MVPKKKKIAHHKSLSSGLYLVKKKKILSQGKVVTKIKSLFTGVEELFHLFVICFI